MLTLLTLKNTHTCRMMQPAYMDTYTMKASHPLASAVHGALQEYRDMITQVKKDESLDADARRLRLATMGSPTAGMVVAFVDQLSRLDIGAAQREPLHKWLDAVEPEGEQMVEGKIERADIEDAIAFVRLESCYDVEMTKLHIAGVHWPLRPAVKAAMRSLGTTITCHTGPAPIGWMEEEAASWLHALEAA